MTALLPLGRIRACVALICAAASVAVLGTPATVRASAKIPLSEIPPRSYVVATYDGSRLRLYVNARLAADTPVTGQLDQTAAPLEIGSYAGQAIWSGAIDEVAVYDRALPPSSIAARYQLGISTHPPGPDAYRDGVLHTSGLVSYWRLDDLGRVALDSHGHNPGVITPGAGKGFPGLITAEADRSLLLNGRLGSVRVPFRPSLELLHAFTAEAWVTTINVANRHIVGRVGSWFLKTDVLGRWSAGVYVNGAIVSASSKFAAHGPRAPGPTQQSASKQSGNPLSPVWIVLLLVGAATAFAALRGRRRSRVRR